MSKLSKQASDRLLNLLYTTSSTEVASKIPAVRRFLYEHTADEPVPSQSVVRPLISVGESLLQQQPPSSVPQVRSILDDLSDNEWRQKPILRAVTDINSKCKTNIIRLQSPSHITKTDFHNIFPINRERTYLLQGPLRDGPRFEMVKARDPKTLEFTGSYLLIFENHVQACVYAKETESKVINGLRVRWEFMDIHNCIRELISPWINTKPENIDGVPSLQLPFSQIYSPETASIMTQICNQPTSTNLEIHPNFATLTKLIDSPQRASSVLVHNLPFGLSKHTLPRLLWNYDLAIRNPVTTITSDILKERHIHLIRFQNPSSANRFVRNFHGRKWDSMQHQKVEKKLYDPIRCEVVG